MKARTNIVMFWFMRDWGLYGRAYEKIAEALVERPEVGRLLCVLPPREITDDRFAWPLTFSLVSKKLWVLSLNSRVVPAGHLPYRIRVWANENLPTLAFKALLWMGGFRRDNTTLWLYPPHWYIAKIKALIPFRRLVVQIVDNNSQLESNSDETRAAVKAQYDELAGGADCVIVSSELNYDIFKKLNDRTFLFENALDRIFLGTASELPHRTGSTRPRLGYVGWITVRTDIDLIDYLATQRPQYDIVLAGPSEGVDLENLKKRPNISFLGAVPYENVPELMKSFDVCLIPHRNTAYSRSMSPLKLFQYLGSGRPVVTTRVAGVERWSEHVAIADSYAEFVSKVDTVLADETLDKAGSRIAAAAQETWAVRIGDMLKNALGEVS